MTPLRPGVRLAAAKVNLFLHVGSRQADGYHPISSLMVFANLGDKVALTTDTRLAFAACGPFAGELPPAADNLVVKARDLYLSRRGLPTPPFKLTLTKNLPTASGLGGGSTDAAATLALLLNAFGKASLSETKLSREMATALGSDVAACLAGRAVIAAGRGERLSRAPRLPVLHAVLANPGATSSTAAVFAAFDRRNVATVETPVLPATLASPRSVAEFLAQTRNDLEPPAIAMEPAIGQVLAALRAQPECLLARMSGSGATAFCLCETAASAQRLALRLQGAHPGWWVRACRLN